MGSDDRATRSGGEEQARSTTPSSGRRCARRSASRCRGPHGRLLGARFVPTPQDHAITVDLGADPEENYLVVEVVPAEAALPPLAQAPPCRAQSYDHVGVGHSVQRFRQVLLRQGIERGIGGTINGKELLNERTNIENRYLKKLCSIQFTCWAVLFCWAPDSGVSTALLFLTRSC